MNGTTQTAHQQLVSAIESALPAIFNSAIESETAPLKAEIESLKLLANKSQDDMHTAGVTAANLVQDKQDIIAGLQSQLEAKSRELEAAVTNQKAASDAYTKVLAELDALKASIANQPAQ